MMASLPSVALSSNVKLESEFKKLTSSSPPVEKNLSISYREIPRLEPAEKDTDSRPLYIHQALSILKDIKHIETATYVPLLEECIAKKSVPEAQMFYSHMVKTGSYQDLFLSTFLINVYAKCGAIQYARKIFNKMPRQNIVAWTSLMSGYIHNSQPEIAVEIYQELLLAGFHPTSYTLGVLLSAASSLDSMELGQQIHCYSIKCQLSSLPTMGNSLCGLYSKSYNLESVVKVFNEISEKNIISWTTIISACLANGDSEMALRYFVHMLLEDARPNEFTLTSVLSACCIMKAFLLGKQIHSLCMKLGLGSNVSVNNSIMYLYLKCGRVVEAQKVFNALDMLTLMSWNAMIAGYAHVMSNEKDDLAAYQTGVEALKIFHRLKHSSLKPDLYTFSSVLSICSSLVALEQGEQVHTQAIKTGFLSDVIVGSALVNMYNKCGSIEKAGKAFVEMHTRTLISWTSMITGFSLHGRSKDALGLFEDMRLASMRPNAITFVGVLAACSREGMVDEALSYFKMMKNEYGITPIMDHYACLIDMFLRLGRLHDALDFIKRMDYQPTEFIWSNVIAGCRSHGNMELAFYAANQMLELKPKEVESYTLLLNMYVQAKRWKDLKKVRKMMKDEKLGKLKDWSWITVKNRIYSFGAGDRSNSQSPQIYELLDQLIDRAKNLGYVNGRSLEMTMNEGDKGKEVFSTVHHSEKLAIAFGLLNTTGGATIRVIKNICMCRDCHICVKFFSALTNRKIIIRDSKSLHRFMDGQCSCGGFGALC